MKDRYIIKCPECGSYHVKKHQSNILRFKCLNCKNTFALNRPLPNHEGQSKRIPYIKKARIVADIKLGISERDIIERYNVSKKTIYRIQNHFETRKNIFVFRVDYDNLDYIRDEVENGRLRQGWDYEDLRRGFDRFRESYMKVEPDVSLDEIEKRFNILKIMLVIKKGDYVIVPKYEGEHTFMICQVSDGYDFDDDKEYRHSIGVENPKVYYSVFKSIEEAELDYSYDVQIVNEILRTTKSFYPALSIVEPKSYFYRLVKKLYGR